MRACRRCCWLQEGPEGEEDEVEDDNESLDQQLLGLDDDLPFSGGSAGGSMLATM